MTQRSHISSPPNEPSFLQARSSRQDDAKAPTLSELALERDRSRVIKLRRPVLRPQSSHSGDRRAKFD